MRLIILIISFLAAQQLLAQNQVNTIRVRKEPAVTNTSTEVFTVVENMPYLDAEACGNAVTKKEKNQCSNAILQKFVINNLKYPAKAIEAGIQGTVFISFVIKADGTMADFKIAKDIGGGCGDEALRAVKLLGEKYKWMAGTQRGQAVDVLYNFPVKFGLR